MLNLLSANLCHLLKFIGGNANDKIDLGKAGEISEISISGKRKIMMIISIGSS